MYGYSGKILHIDLMNVNFGLKKPEEWYKIYIGGVSMASHLCWENIEVGCDPYGPGNPICIANGVFAGTPVPGGKYAIASKSPLTGSWRQPFRKLVLDCLKTGSVGWNSYSWSKSKLDAHHGRRRSGGIFPADKLMGLGTMKLKKRS